jgi:hypothetical protein
MFNAIIIATSLAAVMGQNVLPRPITMQSLTVAAESLPPGCHLKAPSELSPPSSGPGRITAAGPMLMPQPLSITTNPWTGTDPQAVAWMRQGMDNPPAGPDLQPLPGPEATRYFLRLADGVEEGYAATYVQPGGGEVVVHALRFAPTEKTNDLKKASTADLRSTRIDIGRIVAQVYGDENQCRRAIEMYLKSLGQ